MDVFWLIVEAVLVTGFALRLTRLVTGDTLGKLWVRDPAYRRYQAKPTTGRAAVVDLVGCPYCIGFWLTALVVVSAVVAHSAGDGLLLTWRLVAAVFTVSYVVGHTAARLGDVDNEGE